MREWVVDDVRRTRAAIAYIKRERQQRDRLASWLDVSAAFDAGMRLALTNPDRAAQDIAELDTPHA